jgi:hypothetical protein
MYLGVNRPARCRQWYDLSVSHCQRYMSGSSNYSGRKITASFWEGGEDRKTIARREREPSPFLVLYDVKQLGSGCRSIVTEDSCE